MLVYVLYRTTKFFPFYLIITFKLITLVLFVHLQDTLISSVLENGIKNEDETILKGIKILNEEIFM